MAGNSAPSPLHRLRRVKAALLAVSLTLAGILLMMSATWLDRLDFGAWNWLHSFPLSELGGILFGAGLLSTLFEYTFRRDQEESMVARFRQTIHDEAPTLRDSLIEAFRIDRDDLRRIATPELLDDLARTSLGLRFGDPAFGEEVYADIKHQAIAAEERWYDARVDATLGILSLSHQDSCQESCQRVMMTRAAAMIAVMVAGPGGDSLQGLEVLEHGIGPLGRGPQGGQQVVAGLLVRCRAGVLRGCQHADPGPLVPLVRQDRHPQPGRPVQGGQHMESGGGRVVGGAGLHRTRVHREPSENPSPPARCPRRPRPRPEYHRWRPVSGLR